MHSFSVRLVAEALTGDHESILGPGLLRYGEEEPEDAADRVEALHRVSDGRWDATDRRVRPTVGGHDIGVEVDAFDGDPVHRAGHLSADSLSFV